MVLLAFAIGCEGKAVELGHAPGAVDNGAGAGSGGQSGMGGGGGLAASGGSSGSGGSGAGTSGSTSGGEGGAGGIGVLRFLNASSIEQTVTEDIEDNPTLTADGLELFFTSTRGGDSDVWVATRATVDDDFGEAVPVDAANTGAVESSPAISLDGLTLYVGQDTQPGGLGGYDIWVLERSSRSAPWSSPLNVTELNSPEDDIPRPPAINDTVMPLGSRRSLEGYRTYLATRANRDALFGEPMLVDELVVDGQSFVDGFLTEDGLMLFYSSAASENEGDLYYATRASIDDPFDPPIAIFDLNTDDDERDPWLSPDGTTLYFATDREGSLDLFTARVSRE